MPRSPRRSAKFSSGHEPFRAQAPLQLIRNKTSGPYWFFNPTQAHFTHSNANIEGTTNGSTEVSHGIREELHDQQIYGIPHQYRWTSRNNRKGRHQLLISHASDKSKANYIMPQKTSNVKIVRRTIGKMLTDYPVYDISWLVAYIFTWGSIVWVINAFFVWLPYVRPSSEFKGELLMGGGITAFIGATIFFFGSVLLMLEALNENKAGCFGWAVYQTLEHEKAAFIAPDVTGCTHHHQNRLNLVGKSQRSVQSHSDDERMSHNKQSDEKSWTWWPTMHELKTHYLHEIGFLACSAQMFGATVFWISGFTALPGIADHLSPGLENGVYWTPQVIGGSGFIISGILFMLETQPRWYRPAFDVLGWHIGFWNLVGGVGFTLSPAFGYDTDKWAQYEAGLSTFWGSWAFLIGSLIQLYESLQKHPVDEVRADAQVTQQPVEG